MKPHTGNSRLIPRASSSHHSPKYLGLSFALILSAIAMFASATSSSAQTFNLFGSIDNGDPFQNGRLVLNGSPSVAGTQKAFPGIFPPTSTLYSFDKYVFTNGSAISQPVTITLTGLSINPLASATYLGSFAPGNIATNYLGDSGNSSIQGGSSVSYSVTVPAFTAFNVIVNEVNSGGHPAEYGLTVVSPGGIVQVPESSRGILMVSVLFIGLIMANRRFRRVSGVRFS